METDILDENLPVSFIFNLTERLYDGLIVSCKMSTDDALGLIYCDLGTLVGSHACQ